MSVTDLLSNGSCVDLKRTDYYAAILGISPSKGARSPTLWNAAFSADRFPAYMWPFDVSENDLASLVAALKSDAHFIGGAVAVPYKTRIVELLDRVEDEAQAIGAVNAVYRDGNQLVGTNTDGASAILALEEKICGPLSGLRATLIGTGGAGSAVAVYLAHKLGKNGQLVLANRNVRSADALCDRLQALCKVRTTPFSSIESALCTSDILVNCSTIGMELWRETAKGIEYFRPYTPLGFVPEAAPPEIKTRQAYLEFSRDVIQENHKQAMSALAKAPGTLIYDIVYQPARTMLLEFAAWAGLPTLNGEAMNLRQAALAYKKAATATGLCSTELNTVERSMMNACISPRG